MRSILIIIVAGLTVLAVNGVALAGSELWWAATNNRNCSIVGGPQLTGLGQYMVQYVDPCSHRLPMPGDVANPKWVTLTARMTSNWARRDLGHGGTTGPGWQNHGSIVQDDNITFGYPDDWTPWQGGAPTWQANGRKDGGDWAFFDGTNATFFATADPDNQTPFYWTGYRCGQRGWLIFDTSVPTNTWTSTVVKLGAATYPTNCNGIDSFAYTQFGKFNVDYPWVHDGQYMRASVSTIVSEHYGGMSPDVAPQMERFFMGYHYGKLRWESWTKSCNPVVDIPERCPRTSIPDPSGFILCDCRSWTNLVSENRPSYDSLGFPSLSP